MVSSVLLAATSPIIVPVWVAVRLRLGSPALFRQRRPGRDGKPFTLVKFRTMLDPDPTANLVTDADRLTPLGRALRSTSLDELPTLWNVLKGDMSLVGPRPLLMQYLDRYSPEQARRLEVRPGVTGWAQTHGRNSLTWEEKFSFDVWYVDNRSFALDLRILARTLATVVRRQGVSADESATMPEFRGTDGSAASTG